jgi:outer membrane lipoprotein-sorting protein
MLLAVGAALVAALQSRADDAAAVKELLDKAIKATGGADKTAKLASASLKGKGKVTEGGNTAEMSFDLSMQDFDRIRVELMVMEGGQSHGGVMVMSRDKVWFKDNDRNKVDELPGEIAPVVHQFYLAMRLASNPGALAGHKDLTLGHGGEGKVDEKTAAILRVSRKDRSDINIFYDTKSGLPLKAESQIKTPNESEEKKYEFQFSEFKEVDGVKHYSKIKILRDGKDMLEMELSDVKFGEKFEANTFEKPQ